MSRHPLTANPTSQQQQDFDEAVQRCREAGVDSFEVVSVGAHINEDGSTLDVHQVSQRWQIEMRKKTP